VTFPNTGPGDVGDNHFSLANDRLPIEWIRDGVNAVGYAGLTLVLIGVTLALLILGNTLGRLIGVFLLALLMLGAARWVYRRRTSAS
jgi:uncharacterized membrane protein YidH (DUF202 family)